MDIFGTLWSVGGILQEETATVSCWMSTAPTCYQGKQHLFASTLGQLLLFSMCYINKDDFN